MKKELTAALLCVFFVNTQAQTWSEWTQQDKTQRKYLVEQIAKLQLYLGYLKKGYSIVDGGLTLIGDLKQGDLAQHLDVFKRLSIVNPLVKNDPRIARMIDMQKDLMRAYRTYKKQFETAGIYSKQEEDFLQNLLASLLDRTADDLEELQGILANDQLEMNDEARLQSIRRLYESYMQKQAFFFSFCEKTALHALQRKKELEELKHLKKLY